MYIELIAVDSDEAHRATGDYSYNQVIRYMMAKNPHFRILALTATPGSDKEAVQTLIDGLHISRIEIRDERALARYNHEKVLVLLHGLALSAHIGVRKSSSISFQCLRKSTGSRI